MLFLLPLAFSNFLPLLITYGLAVEPGVPGAAPKCLYCFLAVLFPLTKVTPYPSGFYWASWSKVKTVPPAAKILSLAVSLNFKAQIVKVGISTCLGSSRTLPTTTQILDSFPLVYLTMCLRDKGGLEFLLIPNRLAMTALNLEFVLRAKNLYSLMRSRKYKLFDVTSRLFLLGVFPPASWSMP